MSEALYTVGGLRFWSEREILVREQAIGLLVHGLSKALQTLNSAWSFHRMEGPLLTPRDKINSAYDESDIFLLDAKLGDQKAALRAETTASSYLYAEYLMQRGLARAPFVVWQVGKSFRRETNDGARASELRFNEFYQIEFQCIYKDNTKADIRGCAEEAISLAIKQITRSPEVRMVASDRLPSYSTETRDVEVPFGMDETREVPKWKEMASISTRTDFPVDNHLVLEVAVGLDRLVAVEEIN
jgi:glycyl-tRNA synthetase (class II)